MSVMPSFISSSLQEAGIFESVMTVEIPFFRFSGLRAGEVNLLLSVRTTTCCACSAMSRTAWARIGSALEKPKREEYPSAPMKKRDTHQFSAHNLTSGPTLTWESF